ncbi:MAG: DoxX family protein [Acidimicrobiales bacterium]
MLDIGEFNLAMLILRLALGPVIAAHGYQKFFRGGKIDGTAGWFDSMGMKPGKIHAVLAASTEIAAGILILVGLLTSFGAAALVGLMTVAWYTVHRTTGFFILKEGWEYVFMLAIAGIVLAILGPGEISVDSALGIDDDLNGYVGLAISTGLGIGAGLALLAGFFRPMDS